MNEALKDKWLCSFATEEDTTWRNVIETKYEIDDLVSGARRVLMLMGLATENLL